MPKMPVVLFLCLCLAGCQPLALSLAGAGATAAVGASIAGISYRTFTAPLPEVRKASLAALEAMGIELDSTGSFDGGEVILARASARSVEIELEALSRRATRMRVATRDGGFFYDSATATEIIAQTSKALEQSDELARAAKRASN